MPATAQFEAALQIVETLRAQGIRGVSRGRMRARSAAGARAGRLRRGHERDAGRGAGSVSADLCRGRALWRGAGRAGGRRTPALSQRWRRSGRIWRIPMGGIPMRCGTQRPPRRMCERRDFTINGLLLDRCEADLAGSRSFDSVRCADSLRMTIAFQSLRMTIERN